MKISFYTLGCKVNQFETQALGLLLSERGHIITDNFDEADVIVINTCTVTSTSDQKSRRIIRHLAKEHPFARIAVCGCLSQVSPESIKEIGGVSVIIGTSDRKAFVDKIEGIFDVNNISFTVDNALKRRAFELLPAGGLLGHTRAMLKIEDGCSNFCTYCIIPYSRGPVRSMPPENAIEECEKLSREGYREVVITGIEISSYGRDLSPKSSLAEIVSTLCKAYPDIRFRLGSIEPRTITKEFCTRLKAFSNLCPHFHLSMQSGCDETLARMHRKYDTARFFESVSLLRGHFQNCAITTDMIVGFPGETEEEFNKTLEFVRKCEFSSMHIFPYSRRNGTPAAKMDGQITRAEKAARAKRAAALAKELESSYLTRQAGATAEVLFEEISDGYWSGLTENYIRVYTETESDLKNNVAKVLLSSPFRDGLLCKII